MKRVVNVWFADPKRMLHFSTGLVFELEDGTFLAHGSTDALKPFEELEHKTDGTVCWCDPRIVIVDPHLKKPRKASP